MPSRPRRAPCLLLLGKLRALQLTYQETMTLGARTGLVSLWKASQVQRRARLDFVLALVKYELGAKLACFAAEQLEDLMTLIGEHAQDDAAAYPRMLACADYRGIRQSMRALCRACDQIPCDSKTARAKRALKRTVCKEVELAIALHQLRAKAHAHLKRINAKARDIASEVRMRFTASDFVTMFVQIGPPTHNELVLPDELRGGITKRSLGKLIDKAVRLESPNEIVCEYCSCKTTLCCKHICPLHTQMNFNICRKCIHLYSTTCAANRSSLTLAVLQ